MIEQAVLGSLPPRQARALRLALLLAMTGGTLTGQLYPACAVVLLFLPALLTSFFLGFGWGLFADSLVWAIYARLDPSLLGQICFCGLCLFGTAISANTVRKYAQAWEQRSSLQNALQSAREVQRFLEPRGIIRHGPFEVFTSMEVCEHLGGDLVGVRPHADGNLSVFVGDVMGKGPEAALTAAYLKGAFDSRNHGPTAVTPGQIVERLDRQLSERMNLSTFATGVAITTNLATLEWVVSRAGHPAPILVRADGTTLLLDSPGLVMGTRLAERFEERRILLKPGDHLWLFSDGVMEEEVVSDEVIALLKSLAHLPGAQAVRALSDRITEGANDAPRGNEDDRTVVLVRFHPKT